MAAAAQGHHTCVQLLLRLGAKREVKQSDGMSALAIAAYFGHAKAVRALIAAGADVGTTDNEGATPLLLAVREGKVDAAKELLERGRHTDLQRAADALAEAQRQRNFDLITLVGKHTDAATTHGGEL